MHKIHTKEFDVNDFSHEHVEELTGDDYNMSYDFLLRTVDILNYYRKKFLETGDKVYWWQLIQLLPSSYNQKRTVMLNYEVLANIYKSRQNHKLDEWHTFCDWIKTLPYSELITGAEWKIMKVSEICKIVNDCDRLRDILRMDKHKLTDSEINEICDLLWDYRTELLKKEVK